jgi:UDP-N-acetylmuramate--alanine ligase
MTYGFSPRSDVAITHIGFGKERTFFTVSERGTQIGDFTLRLPGKHNALNAAGVIAVLRSLGISVDHIRDGLLSFHGTKRRFEKIGTIRGVTIYDDYAHHPKEIEATIAAARCWYPEKRIITVFQPHTYSRTKALLRDFATAFRQSDIALFTDIYASARETDTLGIDGHILVRETQDHHPHARYTADFTAVRTYLDTIVVPDDIIIFMGAGDIYSWGKRAMRELGKLAPVA